MATIALSANRINQMPSMRERMKFPPTCFIVGTLILTAFGLVAIENIKVGDKVIATDPDTFEQAEKTVVETYVNETQQLIHLTIQGETITTTWNHPFYVEEKGFVPAGELQIGDRMVGVDGESYAIDNYQEEIVETPETVYNFQVEDYHTYYVGSAGVLVHNADCGKSKVLDDEGGKKTNSIMDEVFDGTGAYSGKLEKVNSSDANADMLAERIDGESRVKFKNEPKAREFDANSLN